MEAEENTNTYIEVTQDGIARITSNTPTHIHGIYTEDLQTCLAIILVNEEQSISVIHATSKLSVQSIKNEFARNKINFWTIAYNPAFYPQKRDDQGLQEHIALFIEEIFEVVGKNAHLKNNDGALELFEAERGFVSVNRKGHIDVVSKPKSLLSPQDKELRHDINRVNNYFLTDASDDVVDADIQYDGYSFLSPPSLKKTDQEIAMLLNQPKFSNSLMLSNAVSLRNTVKEKLAKKDLENSSNNFSGELFKGIFTKFNKSAEQLKQYIVKKYALTDESSTELERGLRKAVVNNIPSDIPRFIKLSVNINAANKAGKTALHLAVEKNLIDCTKVLLEQGANFTISDKANKTAYDYATEMNNEEILTLFRGPVLQ
ncbi:MAG: hypothetical protein Tsb005_20120 [Gammaproteobacteria bacterium]